MVCDRQRLTGVANMRNLMAFLTTDTGSPTFTITSRGNFTVHSNSLQKMYAWKLFGISKSQTAASTAATSVVI